MLCLKQSRKVLNPNIPAAQAARHHNTQHPSLNPIKQPEPQPLTTPFRTLRRSPKRRKPF